MVSIIVPTFNEEKNIKNLLALIGHSFSKNNKNYEVIVIDDHSTDRTWEILSEEKNKYPLKIFPKVGKKGKAYSLLQGFEKANGHILAMIDADLQYPPQAIPQMVKAINSDTDVIVANRKNYQDLRLRKILSKTFKFLFGKFLFDLGCDVQSGLKVFKREVFETVKFKPKSPWTFDLEFLHRAKLAGFQIKNIDITFYPRPNGRSHINLIKNGLEMATNAASLRLKRIYPQHIPPKGQGSMLAAGIGYKKRKYITHTTLAHQQSAIRGFLLWQKIAISTLALLIITGFYSSPLTTAIILVAILSTIYFLDVLFNLFLILKSLHHPPEIKAQKSELESLSKENLPIYTILSPLYREAHVLPQFLTAVEALDWPKDKLDVLLLLEEDDVETQKAVVALNLPAYVRVLVVPHSLPKTKPKACNYGLAHAKGEYLVIYDAEDIPDRDQLKKAYLAFAKVPKNVACLQAKLNYYNPHQNLLTRLFTAEYSLWFDVILTGLQSVSTTIPLGGTSNHFRTKDLIALEGWDPFNVTEDADLGVRLFKRGYKTAIIDSTTQEEANSRLKNWLRQRSRWIKGYMQTYLIHMRNPVGLIKTHGIHAFIFQLVIGGKIAFMFINPILWVATIAYFVANPLVGPTIEALYPAPVFYMAVTSFVFGNFLYLYYYMIGCAKRGHWSLIKYVFLVPFYWLAVSTAAVIALYQLIAKPHFWEKTVHGFHLAKEEEVRTPIPAPAPVPPRWIFASGFLLVAAALFGNLFNFVYNAYLGRRLSIEDFGLVSLIGSFLYLSTIPISALGKTVTHRSAFLFGKYKTPARDFWKIIRIRAFLIGSLITAAWIFGAPTLSQYFNAPSLDPFYLFAPAWVVGLILAVDSGFLSGNLKFASLAAIIFTEPLIRLLLAFTLVETGFPQYVYAATPFSMFFSLAIAWFAASRIKQDKQLEDKRATLFPVHFFVGAIATRISIFAFLSFDLILAKHFLPPKEAGEYALLSLVGKMIFFVAALFSQFMNPLVSKAEGESKKTKHNFYKLFFLSSMASLGAFLAVGYFGHLTVPILLGEKTKNILEFLPIYSFAILCFTIASTIVLFYQVRRKYLFSAVSFLLALAQVIGIYLYHASLEQIIAVMAATGIGSAVVILSLHLIYQPLAALARNIRDLFDLLFLPIPAKEKQASGAMSILISSEARNKLSILIFNWRDTKHVWAGGAEVYIHEIAEHFIKEGHTVTVFCGNDGHNPRSEVIDGVHVVRHGGFYTVYLWAFLYYIFKFRGRFDVIIDSENGIPFFTPLYARVPIIGLIHHIHQEVFRAHLSFPLSRIAQFLEGKLMPIVYRNIKMVTISNSSKQAMEELGFGKKQRISIIHPGVDLLKFKASQKTKEPTILYLGRLKPYKSIDRLITAFSQVAKVIPEATLTIAGEGESRQFLEGLTQKLNLDKFVRFVGRVSEQAKADLLAKSWLMVQPSTVEGWGITVIEANAAGTTVVASDVPGLRDSVRNPHSGLLVTWDNQEKWIDAMVKVIKDQNLRKSLEKQAKLWAKNFSWQQSAKNFLSAVLEVKK